MSDRMAAQGEWNPWKNGNQGEQSPGIETNYPWDSSNSEESVIAQSYSTSTADTIIGGWTPTGTDMEIRPTTLDTATTTATFHRGFTVTPSLTNTYSEPTTITSLSSDLSATTTPSTSTLTTSAVVSSRIEDGKSANNTKRTIAIAVPVSVVGAALLFGALFFFLKRRRRRHTGQDIASGSHIDVSQSSTRATLLPLNASSWEIGPPRAPTPLEIPFLSPPPSTNRLSTTTQPCPPPQTQPTSTPTAQSIPLPASPAPRAVPPEQEHAQPGTEHASAPHRTPASPGGVSPASDRPTSPFDHPLDDAMSDISRLSDRREPVHHRGLDDDVSSVSSIGDDDLDLDVNVNRSRTRFNE